MDKMLKKQNTTFADTKRCDLGKSAYRAIDKAALVEECEECIG